MSKSLSFHGPHVTESVRDLANGLTLVVSTQSGVLLGEDPEVVSPRSYATCCDRGTTVKKDSKTLGDIMLLSAVIWEQVAAYGRVSHWMDRPSQPFPGRQVKTAST